LVAGEVRRLSAKDFDLLTLVIGIGMAANLSLPLVSAEWFFSMLVLMTRRLFGKLDHNVERFGMVHALTLVGMF
jgi:hypothetical protein